jgi:hypothetical protein
LAAVVILAMATLARMAPAACLGDCNDDGEVTIDEIIRGVNIALGSIELSECPVFDGSGDGEVTVDELIGSVNNALTGCPAAPSPTPTPPPTATSEAPSATATPSSTSTATPTPTIDFSPTPSQVNLATGAVGVLSSTTHLLRALPSLFSLLLANIPSAPEGVGADERDMMFDCLFGGSAVLSCRREIEPESSPPAFVLEFSECISIGAGGLLTLDGSLTVSGQPGDDCASLPAAGHLSIGNLALKAENDLSISVTRFEAIEADTIMGCIGESCPCTYNQLEAMLSGGIGFLSSDSSGTPILSVAAVFAEGSEITVVSEQSDELCEAILYRSTTTAEVVLSSDQGTRDLRLTNYQLLSDGLAGEDLLGINGTIASTCLGAALDVETRVPLRIDRGAACPISGQVVVGDGLETNLIVYGESGVSIDRADDGSVDQSLVSCLDPLVFLCGAS